MLVRTETATSLAAFFRPHGVALIGASRDPSKLSYAVLRNLLDPIHGYPGPVYPVNPQADEILGQPCYSDIASVPDPVELAIIVVPAGLVPATVEACGKRGLKAAIIISGGFREVGAAGTALEREAVAFAHRYHMRLMGPNCIGVIDTETPLNTTFVLGMPNAGHIAFLSQSGAICGGVIDWVVGRGIGFSRLLSMGNEADVNESDLVPCLAEDERTQVITLYLEDVKNGPGFVSALRDVTRRKPVLALKAGRSASGQAAAASHTGALAGAHAAFRAMCSQTGVIACDTISELMNGAMALAYQPLLRGRHIAILTNAGGPAALAADALEANGLTMAHTSPATQHQLRTFLLPDAQVAGPVDMLGGAGEPDYRRALQAVLDDGATDGVLAILAPQSLVNAAAVVQGLAKVAREHRSRKPLVACLLGEASLKPALATAHEHHVPAMTFPEEAAAALGVLYRRARWLDRPRTDPAPPVDLNAERAHALLGEATASDGRLDAVSAQAVLKAAGITAPPDHLAVTADEATSVATQIGFPVVLKLISAAISHKTDVGGVLLDVQDEAAVREGVRTLLERARQVSPMATIAGIQVQRMVRGGHEVIVGIKRDPTFGPLVMFGMGGIYAEALADVSFRLAPMTVSDAEEMIDELRSARLLAGLRGAQPADRAALVDTLVRVSWLAHACPEIEEMDINPLLVLPEGQGALAADVRIVLR
jgi:acetate---CoA ligase (ADP-forming)